MNHLYVCTAVAVVCCACYCRRGFELILLLVKRDVRCKKTKNCREGYKLIDAAATRVVYVLSLCCTYFDKKDGLKIIEQVLCVSV